jgi:hypothetical protein
VDGVPDSSSDGVPVDEESPYFRLPGVGPDDPSLGAALITWVEPNPEHVVAYNRWYEDDHMITGAMSMPWMFACRRWVAPRRLQHLRAPLDSRIAQPLSAGKYLALYWVNTGRLADHRDWAVAANYRLHAEGRGSCRGAGFDPMEERSHVFTGFAAYRGPTYRDDDVPRDVHTLVQPYAGLVLELIDAGDGDREALHAWLANDDLPSRVGGSVALALRFDPQRLPETRMTHTKRVEGTEAMIALLHFLECDPEDCWAERFADTEERLRSANGVLAAQAAFIPTRHGTNQYTSELF